MKKEDIAIRKIQSLIRSFLFVRRLQYQIYKNGSRRDAARTIIRIYRYLIDKCRHKEIKRKNAILIQKYLKGKLGNDKFVTIKMIYKKL
jgi:hypothetical protein